MECDRVSVVLEDPMELHEQPLPVEDAVVAEEALLGTVPAAPAILAELVIEEISIDGMCGVY